MFRRIRADQVPVRTCQKRLQILGATGVLELEETRHLLGKLALQTGKFQRKPGRGKFGDGLFVALLGRAGETDKQLFLIPRNIRL